MKILVSNVEWDLEDYSKEEQEDILNSIPQKFFLPISDYVCISNLEEIVSNDITEMWGYMHFGFNFEIIK